MEEGRRCPDDLAEEAHRDDGGPAEGGSLRPRAVRLSVFDRAGAGLRLTKGEGSGVGWERKDCFFF